METPTLCLIDIGFPIFALLLVVILDKLLGLSELS